MVWAILLLLGLPLWFIVVGITVTLIRGRNLRRRQGNFPARLKRPGKSRWTRGNAIWVSDVFAFRGSPAAWSEDIVHVVSLALREPSDEEIHRLRRLGDRLQIATLSIAEGDPYEVATGSERRVAMVGPFTAEALPGRAQQSKHNNQNVLNEEVL
ncbi:MAG: hypothetical protein WAN48_05765 [Actinomycetes bacterium]